MGLRPVRLIRASKIRETHNHFSVDTNLRPKRRSVNSRLDVCRWGAALGKPKTGTRQTADMKKDRLLKAKANGTPKTPMASAPSAGPAMPIRVLRSLLSAFALGRNSF